MSTPNIQLQKEELDMSSTVLYRLSALSLIWGSALLFLGYMLHPPSIVAALSDPIQTPVHLLIFFGILLVLFGLMGLYARQSGRVGIPGLLGFLLLGFGLPMIEMPHTMGALGLFPILHAKAPGQESGWIQAFFSTPGIGLLAAIAIPVTLLGLVFTGIMTLRAHVVSRWIGIAFLSIVVLNFAQAVPGLADFLNSTLHFPAEIYLVFALIGVLFLSDKGAAEPGAQEKTEVSRAASEHPTSPVR